MSAALSYRCSFANCNANHCVIHRFFFVKYSLWHFTSDCVQCSYGSVCICQPMLYMWWCTSCHLSPLSQVFNVGKENRATAATNMNEHSSRSHALMCVSIVGTNKTTGAKTLGNSRLYLTLVFMVAVLYVEILHVVL